MPAKKNKEVTTRSLTPNAVTIKVGEMEITVPTDKAENAMMGIILAARGRAFIHKAIDKWVEAETIPNPKELRDLAGAIRDINESCGAIFEKIELPTVPTKPADKVDTSMPDFSKMDGAIEVKVEEKKDGSS
jgi:hypothetical protein